MKILFGFILSIIFLICFVVAIFFKPSNPAIIAFTPFSFIAFVAHFCVQFLDLDINIFQTKIKKRVLSLETTQKELEQVIKSLYHLTMINFNSTKYSTIPEEFGELTKSILDELNKFVDDEDFKDKLKKIDDDHL